MSGTYREAIRAIRAVDAAHKARTAHELRRRPRLRRDALTPLQACLRAMMQAPDLGALYGVLHAAYAADDVDLLATAERAFDMRAAEIRLEDAHGR